MALTEEVVIDQITVLEDGVILHRVATRVFRDGVKIAETYHRASIAPSQDYSGLDKRITDIADVVQTQEVKDAYSIKMSQQLSQRPIV